MNNLGPYLYTKTLKDVGMACQKVRKQGRDDAQKQSFSHYS